MFDIYDLSVLVRVVRCNCNDYVLDVLADFGVEAVVSVLQLPVTIEIVEHEGCALSVNQGKPLFHKLVTLLQIHVHGQQQQHLLLFVVRQVTHRITHFVTLVSTKNGRV